jgi:hypothetical protein
MLWHHPCIFKSKKPDFNNYGSAFDGALTIRFYRKRCQYEGGKIMFTNIKSSLKTLAAIQIAIFAILIVPGISFAEIGSIRISKEVAKDFEAYRFDPNYNYYYVNLENNPCAAVGLQKDYTVDDILWTKISPGSNAFNHVIELVKRFPMANSPAFGAYILDSQGNTIGVYYSSAGAGVTVNKESKTLSLAIYMGGTHHN